LADKIFNEAEEVEKNKDGTEKMCEIAPDAITLFESKIQYLKEELEGQFQRKSLASKLPS